eukprot:4167063-Pleurochrysis_carterae.AAC.3
MTLAFLVAQQVVYDMYVVNTTVYVPNNAAERNGKRGGTADFGVINLADDQRCTFEFVFVAQSSGLPYRLSSPLEFFLFDFDTGEDGRLTESAEVCGVEAVLTSTELYGIQSTVEVTRFGSDCYNLTGTLYASGDNNPGTSIYDLHCLVTKTGYASEVFLPVPRMSNYTIDMVVPCLVLLRFPTAVLMVIVFCEIVATAMSHFFPSPSRHRAHLHDLPGYCFLRPWILRAKFPFHRVSFAVADALVS